MLKNFPDEKYISDRNASFIKRVYLLRQAGVILCFIPIYSVLEEQSHHKITIALLILNALTWPSIAYIASIMSKDMLNTEKKNMILDSCWAGMWIAVMQVSPIPSIFIVSIQIADRYAAGGWRILKPALLCMLLSFTLIWLLNDFNYTTEFSTRTVWFSLPLVTCYPILLSVVSRRLSIKLRKRRELLEKQALMDPGLDLPNRRFFEQKMEGAFRATRKKRILSYLLLIDVDNFKYINDTYGHEVGDAVLSRISTILRECAGAQDIPARFGGDELAVIVNNSNDQLVLAMVHAIQERIEVLSLPSHKDISCTVSIGISCAKNKTSIISWIKEADEMLYEVKRNGKNGFCMKSNKK
ncbi:diguanylate cyclase [Raoultella sp. Lac2]|jgi:diguanylate cyclase (GGDEF)-like protein|uniref:diguanylate cyclase n=1 Tax=Klebsiella electrica TaxID=1259973 RepID=A0AAJ5UGI2_9ENTR|nr:diguanylate cyclase [Klebsiella electrica]MXF49120.1 diguanylate cyclase [Raoultella sp. Lac2]MXF99025.1 diguanylate cyclase [Raoultella sp. Lac1]BBV76039.1 diguanylate cyclase AdrA [Raoultella planticola]WBW63263.1 diguanylate cyclase [Klebsiella electrica]WIO41347.1 diguanylate cyclase [Klebsiella electrica]